MKFELTLFRSQFFASRHFYRYPLYVENKDMFRFGVAFLYLPCLVFSASNNLSLDRVRTDSVQGQGWC